MGPSRPGGIRLPTDPAAELPPEAVPEGRTTIEPAPETLPRGPIGPASPPLEPWTAPSPPIVPPTGEPTLAIPPSTPGAEEILIEGGSPTPPSPTGPPGPMDLAYFEQMALQHNPTLDQAVGQMNVSRGRAWQAALWPNPFVFYLNDQVGVNGTPGEFHGARIQQEIPSANKRRVSRRKYEWEAEAARQFLNAQELRVLNGVRIRYFEFLAHQRILDYRRLLLKIADAGLRTTEQMVNIGQSNRPLLLAAQVAQQQARVNLIHAENQYRRAWINLVTVAGVPELGTQPRRLEGPLEIPGPFIDFDQALAVILEHNPQLHAAMAEVRRDEVTVMRERLEPIPNTFVRFDVGYNFVAEDTVAGAFIGWQPPVWNKNQGTIFQAQSDLKRAEANVERIRLALTNRLSDVYARYNTALGTVNIYREESLPRAQQAYQLIEEGYRQKRTAWPQVLVAQREWVELSIAYVNALFELKHREIEILGLLEVDGLDAPPGPTPLGHLNAIATPR